MSKNLLPAHSDGPDGAQDEAALSDQAEARMRQSLAMLSSGPARTAAQPPPQSRANQNAGGVAPRRHRFRQDGEVPVVHVSNRPAGQSNGHVAEAAADESHRALTDERLARRQSERALESAQATIRALQARIAHAELALQEATARAQAGMTAIQGRLRDEQAALAAERAARIAAERAVEALRERPVQPTPPPAAEPPAKPRVLRPRVAKPPGTPKEPRLAKEPKPVKWWR